MDKTRCPWCEGSDTMRAYHDTEWGVPLHDDLKLFEFMVLDAFQAGLSWAIVLNKREGFKKAFVGYNLKKVAKFTTDDVEKLMNNPEIIRNRLKITSTITNAEAFIRVQSEYSSFDNYIWSFTGGKAVYNSWKEQKQLPARTTLSDTMSKELKNKGFKFVGSTICYAFMQAAGLVNDHLVKCYRHNEVKKFL